MLRSCGDHSLECFLHAMTARAVMLSSLDLSCDHECFVHAVTPLLFSIFSVCDASPLSLNALPPLIPRLSLSLRGALLADALVRSPPSFPAFLSRCLCFALPFL